MTEWNIAGNPKRYDLFNAFHDLGKVDWKQPVNVEAGDIVYIYVSVDYQKIMFKCRVNKVDLEKPEIDDSKYDLSGEFDGTYGRYMELEPVDEFDTDLFKRTMMERFGFFAPQGFAKVKPRLKEYLDVVQELLNAEEMDPDKYDGTYELARETVRAYKNMGDLSGVDYRDLNLLYHMVLGTWKLKISKKKESVDKSNLPVEEKERLKTLLDHVWDKAQQGYYECKGSIAEGGEISIGMFGTGLYSFDQNDEGEAARAFLGLCTEILDMTDENEIYSVVEKYFSKEYTRLKTGSASAMLHCIKPCVFPILNTNFGNNPIYEYLGVHLNKPGDLVTFAENCRKIKEFRDTYFKVKNYRIYDMASWNVTKDPKKLDSMDFIPSIDEYDPGISAIEYERYLKDESVVRKTWLDVLKNLYKMGGTGTCKQIAAQYGNGAPHYVSNAINIARAVASTSGCPMYTGDDGKEAYWPVLFYGKDAPDKEEGEFLYKMREPLMEAMKSLEENDAMKIENTQTQFDKNMILYGPPGTGKTYNTVIYAVAIVEKKEIEVVKSEAAMDYAAVKRRFDEYKSAGRIAFTTFHQSYGYEEFIEGIKPVMDDDNSEVSYTIASGLFKEFCTSANKSEDSDNQFDLAWNKMSEEAVRNGNKYVFTRRTGTTLATEYDQELDKYYIPRPNSKNDLTKTCVYTRWKEHASLEKDDTNLTTGKKWRNSAYDAVIDGLKKFGLQEYSNSKRNNEPCVFIIDEINRGNISKIFGELITLIEDTKREGMPEAASAILPYSGEKFSVPKNVYILGTMNTADRSIALMDTALRRRFSFEEMMPDVQILQKIGADKVEDLDVAKMLETINKRIEYLYDREHMIGHAFFTGLKDDPTIENLSRIFKKSIIPLLQEYFYEDYQKIRLVLGDNEKSDKRYQFIKKSEDGVGNLFKGEAQDLLDIPEEKYEINDGAFAELQSYIEIYE